MTSDQPLSPPGAWQDDEGTVVVATGLSCFVFFAKRRLEPQIPGRAMRFTVRGCRRARLVEHVLLEGCKCWLDGQSLQGHNPCSFLLG